MNHCILEVTVKKAPSIRYTQENQTPIAEMYALFESLRADDPPGEIKVVGWGNLAQDLQSRVREGQRLVLEGRLRMNTFTRQDGIKEKNAEITLSRFHEINPSSIPQKALEDGAPPIHDSSTKNESQMNPKSTMQNKDEDSMNWNSSPLVPETDDIPF